MALKILPFKDEYSKAFYELNIEWLETYFYVEDFDKEVLSNPKKYVIDPGGFIFFAKYNSEIIGVVALINQKTLAIETGIQNSGLGLLLIFTFFEGLGGMAILVAFWGIWHIVSGLIIASLWSKKVK